MEIRSGIKAQNTSTALKSDMCIFDPGNTFSTFQKQAPRNGRKGLQNQYLYKCVTGTIFPCFSQNKSVKVALRSSILADMSSLNTISVDLVTMFLPGTGNLTMLFIRQVINSCTYHQPRLSSPAVPRLDRIWTLLEIIHQSWAFGRYYRQSQIHSRTIISKGL